MSYPQPKSADYVSNAFEFFRLNTLLSSPGDIYESESSGLALAVGPNSDIADVMVAYFDPEFGPTFLNTVMLGPQRSFVGRVDANLNSTYSPSQRLARILIWSGNLYDPNFRPRAFSTDNHDVIQFIDPVLDVVEYLQTVPSLVPQRADKEFQFQNYPFNGGGATFYLVVPYYGRKLASIVFTNRNATTPNTFGISGVNYAITDDSSPNPYHQETVIHTPAAVAVNGQVVVNVTATGTGMFDALVFSFNNPGPAPLRIVVSDQD